MLNVRFNRRVLWILALIAILPVLWMLQIEVAYERNVRHGIPAQFTQSGARLHAIGRSGCRAGERQPGGFACRRNLADCGASDLVTQRQISVCRCRGRRPRKGAWFRAFVTG